MTRSYSLILALTLGCSLIALSGCSDDDGGTPTRDVGVDSASVDATASGDDAAPGVNECANASDQAALQESYDGKSFAQVVSGCGQGCVTSQQPSSCIEGCVNTATNDAASPSCIGCFSQRVVCTIQNCLLECAGDKATSVECARCSCGKNGNNENCATAYETCSGVPSTVNCDTVLGGDDGGVDATAADAGVDASAADAS